MLFSCAFYEKERGFNVGFDVSGIDKDRLSMIISKPWADDGKNFSERIWDNREKLISSVHKELTQGIILGADPQKAIDSIAKSMNTSKHNAGRLIMTESAYFSSAARRDCFIDLGVEEYKIVATLDSKTSKICREFDGKHFPVKDFRPGATAPPFHCYCRSDSVPYFSEDFGEIGKRAARGKDGKSYYVPGDISYGEWKKAFVEGDKTGLTEGLTDDIIKEKEPVVESVEDIQTFAEMQSYMKDNYSITVDDSVGLLDFQSVRESVQGIEYVMKEFPQAQSSFKAISTKKSGLMCAGYDGDINFNPGYYQSRKTALWNHGIGEGTRPSGLHPKGNNCFGSGSHEAGHILEKALVDKVSGESLLGRLSWNDCTYAKAMVSDACKAAKKLSECKGMTNSELKGAISGYAKQDASECLAEAVCDVSLNGEDAAPLAKIIWEMLKKELG